MALISTTNIRRQTYLLTPFYDSRPFNFDFKITCLVKRIRRNSHVLPFYHRQYWEGRVTLIYRLSLCASASSYEHERKMAAEATSCSMHNRRISVHVCRTTLKRTQRDRTHQVCTAEGNTGMRRVTTFRSTTDRIYDGDPIIL